MSGPKHVDGREVQGDAEQEAGPGYVYRAWSGRVSNVNSSLLSLLPSDVTRSESRSEITFSGNFFASAIQTQIDRQTVTGQWLTTGRFSEEVATVYHGVPSWTHILVFSSFNPAARRTFIVVIALPNPTLWCLLDHDHGVPSWTHILVFSSFNPVARRRFIVVIPVPNPTLWCPLDHGVPSWSHILVFSSFNPVARWRFIVNQTGHFWGMRTEYHDSALAGTSSVTPEIIFGYRYLKFPTPRGIHRMLPREYLVELVYCWLAFPCITLIDKRSGNLKIRRNNPVPMWKVFYGLIFPSALKWRRYDRYGGIHYQRNAQTTD
ncbi:hypothetical protein C8R45DRAFT_935988 [Mycena sanguinolenta]|nr:hypothetical protein C8R45DRAFT_935988 [Mycena sanguinolenta]